MPNPALTPDRAVVLSIAEDLVPLFQRNGMDRAFALEMASSAIDAYQPESRADCLNIARTIAFSKASLALMGRAAGEADAQQAATQARATTLSRAADQCERAMAQRRRAQAVPAPALPAPALPARALQPKATAMPEIPRALKNASNAEIDAKVADVMRTYGAAFQMARTAIHRQQQPAPAPALKESLLGQSAIQRVTVPVAVPPFG